MKYLIILFVLIGCTTYGQDATRFASDVAAIQKKYDTLLDSSKETYVFTGSSSIRMWKDLSSRFPKNQIVNSGFGGSQASDLLVYLDQLVLNYKPKKVFIYEGDNDISAKKTSKEIIATTTEIINKIRLKNPNTQVVLIAAKPSISRWNLKRDYKKLNRKFKKLSRKDPLTDFADVWKPMIYKKNVLQDIFIEDGLHMNAKGYNLWYEVIKNHLP
ncbi:G-D-S-L family lipolytic protein [Aurantibacter crassamenti]|uniref:SGNH/GDSL hydrolase family protein n=1 Tax=Aurantibacter crassamenti TaxID=1837375 RepID=UPI00193A973D|nr:SGNH/GDSL hydrolase family protein [Aurantibacter crassamenti]MBM1106442.1 G-D-S-L family lipolytic protein [Aurantibacter crassamenti]